MQDCDFGERLDMRVLFGNKEFYKRVIMLSLPIMIQNAITNFVNLLDNIMVGRVGTEAMSGVAVFRSAKSRGCAVCVPF